MASGGFSDKIQVLEETAFGDGGAAGEVVFGVTKTFNWTVDTSTQTSYGLETDGPQGTVNTDGVLQITGSHEWEFTDGRELKAIFGSLPTNTGGNFTLDVAGALPSYSVKAIEEADAENVIIKGLKYTKVSLSLTRDETVTVTAEWIAQTIDDTGAFTPTASTVEPLVYLDGCFDIAGTTLSGVETITVEIDRQCVARRFIQSYSTGERRLISTIIEGPLALTFNGEVTAQRDTLEEVFGDTTLQDVRSDTTVNLKLERGSVALDLDLTGVRFTTDERSYDKTNEVSIKSFSGIALDISGSGTYDDS